MFPVWLTLLVTAIVGIIALRTLSTISVQTDALNRQNDMIVSKERARIAVEIAPHDLTLEDGPQWTEDIGAVYAGSKISVINFGANDAINVKGIGVITGSSGDTLYPSGAEEIALNIPNPLRPTIDPISADIIALLKGVDHVAKIKDKTETLHLSGTVTYEDIYGNEYKTEFRYIWEQEIIGVDFNEFDTSRWQKTSDGNRAT